MWNLKRYNKLVNKKKRKQIHKYREHREQAIDSQWGEVRGRGGQDRGKGFLKNEKVLMGLHEIMCEIFESCKAW